MYSKTSSDQRRASGPSLPSRGGPFLSWKNVQLRSRCPPTQIVMHSGWWLTYPSEKYWSVGMIIPYIYGKIKNVPNHQPALYVYPCGDCYNLKYVKIKKWIWSQVPRKTPGYLVNRSLMNSGPHSDSPWPIPILPFSRNPKHLEFKHRYDLYVTLNI